MRGFAPTSRAARQLDAEVESKTLQKFLARLGTQDRVLLIGDIRQHQGVEAGRPFEQLQEPGMRTAKLDEIVRQKDPALNG